MVNENIITKDYINENVRPFTPNDTLFSSAYFEVVIEDLQSIVGNKVTLELLNEDNTKPLSSELEDALNESLRKAIAYLVFARCVRTAQSVITKYGYVQKNGAEYSNPTNDTSITNDSNYFKKIGMDLARKYTYLNGNTSIVSDNTYNCIVIGD